MCEKDVVIRYVESGAALRRAIRKGVKVQPKQLLVFVSESVFTSLSVISTVLSTEVSETTAISSIGGHVVSVMISVPTVGISVTSVGVSVPSVGISVLSVSVSSPVSSSSKESAQNTAKYSATKATECYNV